MLLPLLMHAALSLSLKFEKLLPLHEHAALSLTLQLRPQDFAIVTFAAQHVAPNIDADEAQFLVADAKCERCSAAAAGHCSSRCRLCFAVAEARSLSLSQSCC